MIHQTRPPIFFHWSMLQLTLMWPFLCVFDQGISNVPLTDQQLHCPKSTSCAALFVLTPLNHSQQFVLRLLFGGIRADGLALAPHMHLWALGANVTGSPVSLGCPSVDHFWYALTAAYQIHPTRPAVLEMLWPIRLAITILTIRTDPYFNNYC